VTPTLACSPSLHRLSPLKWAPSAALVAVTQLSIDLCQEAPREFTLSVSGDGALCPRAGLATRGCRRGAQGGSGLRGQPAVRLAHRRGACPGQPKPLRRLRQAPPSPAHRGLWTACALLVVLDGRLDPALLRVAVAPTGAAPSAKPARALISWISSLMDIAGQDAELPEIRHRLVPVRADHSGVLGLAARLLPSGRRGDSFYRMTADSMCAPWCCTRFAVRSATTGPRVAPWFLPTMFRSCPPSSREAYSARELWVRRRGRADWMRFERKPRRQGSHHGGGETSSAT